MNEHLRQTGRTSRMLAKAVSYHMQGRAVYVYVHEACQIRHIKNRLGEQFSMIKVEVLPEGFNWETMRPHDRMHPNCVVLVDHTAVERHLADFDKKILHLQQLARQLYHLTT